LAKPNYAFAKRQRDLAKKQKKEEKIQERKLRKTVGPGEEADAGEESADGSAPVEGGADPGIRPEG